MMSLTAKANPAIVRELHPSSTEARLRDAITQAAVLTRELRKGKTTPAQLAEALILQAILSGDVQAAAWTTRTKLAKENLRLRQRIALTKLRTEQLKQRAAQLDIEASEKKLTPEQLIQKVRAIYGLDERDRT